MKVWRDDELADGWFPRDADIVPNLTVPLIVVTVVLIAVTAVAAVVRLGRRH